MEEGLFVGVEGGGTNTKLVILDESGTLQHVIDGPSSNPNNLAAGFDAVAEIINSLVVEAKSKLNCSKRIVAIGLCLSGVETAEIKSEMRNSMLANYPNLCKNYYVGSDTAAPMALVSDKGGTVLISGTGSNCLLTNPDNSSVQCGGFGYVLGDEGSAYWISRNGIKYCLDAEQNFKKHPEGYSTSMLLNAIKDYFKVENCLGLINVFYGNFKKDFVANFCLEIMKLAEKGDLLSLWLFEEAGRDLARHVQAVYPHAHKSLISDEGGLKVVCVGSVWKSWKLLKNGFINQLTNPNAFCRIKELTLIRIHAEISIGAAYLAASEINISLPRLYGDKIEKLFHWKCDQ